MYCFIKCQNFYIGSDNQNKPTKVSGIKNALGFDTEKKANDFMKSLSKIYAHPRLEWVKCKKENFTYLETTENEIRNKGEYEINEDNGEEIILNNDNTYNKPFNISEFKKKYENFNLNKNLKEIQRLFEEILEYSLQLNDAKKYYHGAKNDVVHEIEFLKNASASAGYKLFKKEHTILNERRVVLDNMNRCKAMFDFGFRNISSPKLKQRLDFIDNQVYFLRESKNEKYRFENN